LGQWPFPRERLDTGSRIAWFRQCRGGFAANGESSARVIPEP
jgi:hypothetical protein